jgi:hypothetical protein
MRHRWISSGLLGAAALALGGCAVSPFYNEARDKQGQALTAATAKVDLGGAVEDVGKRFEALRALELEMLRTRAATQRELDIAGAVSAGPDGRGTLQTRYVGPLLDGRIQALVGRPLDAATLDTLLGDAAAAAATQAQADSLLRAFNSTSGLDLADCTAAAQAVDAAGQIKPELRERIAPNRRAAAQALMPNLLRRCREAPPAPSAAGRLAEMQAQQKAAADAAATYRARLSGHRQALREATARYQQAVDAATPKTGDATAAAALASAAGTLSAALGTLQEAAQLDAAAFGHAHALENVNALQEVVDAVASGSTDLSKLSASEKRAVGLVRLIASVADEADALASASRKPRLAPLLLALEQQRLMVRGFEARLAVLERRAVLRQQQLDAARDELSALARARRVLGPPPSDTPGATVNLSLGFREASEDGAEGNRRRAALFESVALYFDVARHHRQRADEFEMAFNATSDELVMQASRTAAAQWASLMQQMAAVLAEHHAAGIKPADLAEFLKGFGLVTIATQVGK